jgi:hypothetical protein
VPVLEKSRGWHIKDGVTLLENFLDWPQKTASLSSRIKDDLKKRRPYSPEESGIALKKPGPCTPKY